MAEEITTIAPDQKQNQTPSEVENYKRQLDAAQKELSEKNTKLTEAERGLRDAEELVQLIQSDENLVKEIRNRYDQKYGRGSADSNKENEGQKKNDASKVEDSKFKEHDEKITNVEKTQRNTAIKDFEEKRGISNLSKDEQKDVRAKMGNYMATFGKTINDIPLDSIDVVLDAAYKAITVEKAVAEGKMEAVAAAYTASSGAFGSMSGRDLNNEGDSGKLTSEQQAWNAKLGVDNNKAEKVYKDKDNEWKRPGKAESKSK